MQTTQAATDSAEPRPSSTVVLVRSAEPLPEIFMVRRHARSSFGSAYAFPGGVLEPADRRVHDCCAGISTATANRLLGLEHNGLDYYSAAVRELFEESGVLLGECGLDAVQLATTRTRLNDGSLSWDAFVRESDVTLDCAALSYFSFWITPVELPRRYSTRFFLAELPTGQSASHCGGELTDSCWMSAREVLQARKAETMTVHYPTRKTLERLAEFDSTSDVHAWAARCAAHGVVCDQPALSPDMLR